MPREHKKRGRRETQKRARHDDHDEVSPTGKRRRVSEDQFMHEREPAEHEDTGDGFISFDNGEDDRPTDLPQNQFYGLLESDEQEYYANVNAKISANDFETDEDRALFIEAVHRETRGKEMKVASSQSSSRYLEKIIALSTEDQLKSLFTAFLEDLPYLVQHRFGSHCCETLFSKASEYVGVVRDKGEEENSLESLYIRTVEVLEPNIGFLLTERFASHTLRVLLLVLSGEPLQDESTNSMIASRRKEKAENNDDSLTSTHKRKVPKSFHEALQRLVNSMVSSIDTTYLRALATHPVGNPVLQLLLKLELTGTGKLKQNLDQSLLGKLLPDPELEAESDSGKFILGLMYDPTGSHLVEALVQHLPGKTFKKLYKNILKERMRNLAKNDVASYVAIKVLERLGKDDLLESSNEIVNEVSGLVSRSRTGVLKVLFERCTVREVNTQRLSDAVKNGYGADEVTILPKMLQFQSSIEDLIHNPAAEGPEKSDISPYKADVHGSLLAQAMLRAPIACNLIQQCILSQPDSSLIAMAKHPIASRVLQAALKSPQSSSQFRRKFVPRFYGHIAGLAANSAGSHVADALWDGTSSLHHIKERLAKELQENEASLRNSNYGRTVWRNWSMDTYTRHYHEWQNMAKGRDQDMSKVDEGEVKKTPIELARERYAAKRGKPANRDARQ